MLHVVYASNVNAVCNRLCTTVNNLDNEIYFPCIRIEEYSSTGGSSYEDDEKIVLYVAASVYAAVAVFGISVVIWLIVVGMFTRRSLRQHAL